MATSLFQGFQSAFTQCKVVYASQVFHNCEMDVYCENKQGKLISQSLCNVYLPVFTVIFYDIKEIIRLQLIIRNQPYLLFMC